MKNIVLAGNTSLADHALNSSLLISEEDMEENIENPVGIKETIEKPAHDKTEPEIGEEVGGSVGSRVDDEENGEKFRISDTFNEELDDPGLKNELIELKKSLGYFTRREKEMYKELAIMKFTVCQLRADLNIQKTCLDTNSQEHTYKIEDLNKKISLFSNQNAILKEGIAQIQSLSLNAPENPSNN